MPSTTMAAVVVGRHEPEVVAHGHGQRIAVQAQGAACRQQREHRRLDRWDALQDGHGARTQCRRGWMWIVVPLQVEALPAAPEKGIEADVVVFVGRADALHLVQRQRFLAERAPFLFEIRQFGKAGCGHERRRRHGGKQVAEAVQRRRERGVVGQLPEHAMAHAAAQVHDHRAGDEQQQDDPAHRRTPH